MGYTVGQNTLTLTQLTESESGQMQNKLIYFIVKFSGYESIDFRYSSVLTMSNAGFFLEHSQNSVFSFFNVLFILIKNRLFPYSIFLLEFTSLQFLPKPLQFSTHSNPHPFFHQNTSRNIIIINNIFNFTLNMLSSYNV